MPLPKELLARVIEELPVAVIVAEAPSGRLVLSNAAVGEVWRQPFIPAEAVEGYDAYVGFHPDGRQYRPEEWPLARAMSTGEVVRAEEIEIARGDGTRGIIDCSALPLRDAAGEVVAAVVVFEDVTEARAVAQDLARVLEDQRRTAMTLQIALLPPALPDIPGFEVAARYLPADGRHLVGGDFYDAVAMPEGWLLAVGDVCGKGIDAAVLTSLARHSIRTAVHYEDGPGGVLAALNRALRAHDPSRALLTATVAHLDPAGRLQVAGGGHPPTLLRRASGEIEVLDGQGLMLGVADDVPFPAAEAQLEPGDTLLLYTDGVTEARAPGGFFGEDRLSELLTEPGEVDEVVGRVADALSAPGVSRRDDVALVALRRAS